MSKRDFQFKKSEWLRFLRGSHVSYRINALRAAYETDGEEMLKACLKELGWELSVDLLKSDEAKSYLRG